MIYYPALLPALLLWIVISSVSVVAQTPVVALERVYIELSNGEKIEGVIEGETESELVVVTSSGQRLAVRRSAILSISKMKKIDQRLPLFGDDESRTRNFSSAGFTFSGLPIFLNARVGYHGETPFAFHLTGMYWWNSFYGIQMNPMWSFAESGKTNHYLSAVIGYTAPFGIFNLPSSGIFTIRTTITVPYFGIGYVWHSKGFLFELAGVLLTPRADDGRVAIPLAFVNIGFVPRFY